MFRKMNYVPVIMAALALVGCGQKQQPTPSADAAPKVDANAVALGKANTAGRYTVTLFTSEAPIKVGDVPFSATVERAGAPVKDATVKLTLSMPKMNMPGPSVPLQWDGKEYAGKVEAGMAGEWQADLQVDAGAESGHAAWIFHVEEMAGANH